MAYTFLLTYFMICGKIFFSFGACPYEFRDLRYGIPTECSNSDCKETFATPTNHICSISYLLYTNDNMESPCYVEPENQEFDRCKFDPYIQTNILIHGHTVKSKARSILDPLKENLPSVENSNLIIVNWTKYTHSHGKYRHRIKNAYIVGMEVGKFINFLVDAKGVNPLNVHIISDGFGAHVAGVAEKFVPGLQRIIGFPEFIEKRVSRFYTKNFPNGAPETIANNNDSIQYHLYTPEHPEEVCYFEPDLSNKCSFNSTYKTKVLIHGYTVLLLPGNLYEEMKNTLLEYNKYNVIIVNWTQYDGSPYAGSVARSYIVGQKVGKMIHFLVSNKGVNQSDVHLIGHSLGAHIAGVAGKQVPNLGRITGLDPAGILFSQAVTYNRLTYTSADFVDVIHTSNYFTGKGFGLGEIGSIDFYPNRGIQQPACKIGGTYINSDAGVVNITSEKDVGDCNHDIVQLYFLSSIHTCKYLSVECPNYLQFSEGKCNSGSNPTDRMGFHSAPIQDLPVESTFYLKTSATSPFC